MKIMKKILFGVGVVSASAIAFAGLRFDWHLDLMRENAGLFLKAILINFVIGGSSVFIGGVLLSVAMCNSWVKRVLCNSWVVDEEFLFIVFCIVGSCLVLLVLVFADKGGFDVFKYEAEVEAEVTALKYRKAAERGEADAQYRLGDCYAVGRGVEKNDAEAVKWYRKAAEQGDADAQYSLGECYAVKDETEALKWYHKAAEQGHEGAKGRLVGWYKLEEDRAVKSYRKAEVGWYRKAAEQGCVIAQFRLGMCYATGTGVEQNQEKAKEWFDKIKDPFDQFMIGNCFLAPLDFDFICDEVMAMKWYRKAAEQGYADAQYMLGLCYCVKQDKPEAVKWLQKAAKQGHEKAKKALTEVSKQKGAEPK